MRIQYLILTLLPFASSASLSASSSRVVVVHEAARSPYLSSTNDIHQAVVRRALGEMHVEVSNEHCSRTYTDTKYPWWDSDRVVGSIPIAGAHLGGVCVDLRAAAPHPGFGNRAWLKSTHPVNVVECRIFAGYPKHAAIYSFAGPPIDAAVTTAEAALRGFQERSTVLAFGYESTVDILEDRIDQEKKRLEILLNHICWVEKTYFWPDILPLVRATIQSSRSTDEARMKNEETARLRVAELMSAFEARHLTQRGRVWDAHSNQYDSDDCILEFPGVVMDDARRWALRHAVEGLCLLPDIDASEFKGTGVYLTDKNGDYDELECVNGDGGSVVYSFIPTTEDSQTDGGSFKKYDPFSSFEDEAHSGRIAAQFRVSQDREKEGDEKLETNLKGEALETGKRICASVEVAAQLVEDIVAARNTLN